MIRSHELWAVTDTDYIGLFFNISVSAGLLSLWFLMVSVIILKAHVMRPVTFQNDTC